MNEDSSEDLRDGAPKGPDAFRTISEVAEELGLPQHVLRFWETRFPQIKPVKRGGGRRYYRPADVDLLRGVKALLYGKGYTIRGVQRILREQGGRGKAQAIGLAEAGRGPAVETHEELDFLAQDSEPSDERPAPGVAGSRDLGPEAWAPVRRPATEFVSAPQQASAAPRAEAREGHDQDVGEGFARAPEPPAKRLSHEQTARLAAALDDMKACRRLLERRG